MRRRRRSLQFVGLDIRSPRRLDKRLAEFIDMAYQEGEPISYAGHLLSAVKRFHPPMRMRLPTSSQYYRNWQRSYQPVRAVPASWDLIEALMGAAFHRGDSCWPWASTAFFAPSRCWRLPTSMWCFTRILQHLV